MPRLTVLTVVAVLSLSTTVSAQDAVEFDTRRVFACREIPSPPQADLSQKVIVVVIPVSANFNAAAGDTGVGLEPRLGRCRN
ncbi:MAG: hypothetical protein ABSE84_04415 [Isosphaeraceae bacterium]|jgi:hypothetical protein